MTVFKAAPGARVIITSPTNTPPNIYMSDYMRLDGLWIGGSKQTSDQTGIFTGPGGSGISHWKQIVNSTIFGYYGTIKANASEYLLFQGNRFVHTGGGTLYHSIYVSSSADWPPPAGTATQHTIVDNNIFIAGAGDGGYAIHFFHFDRTGIITRNFVTYQSGIVFDDQEVLAANNFFWKCSNGTAINWGYTAYSRLQNNIVGPSSSVNPGNYGPEYNVITKNAFDGGTTYGTSVVSLTPGQEAAQIGISATALDGAIAALNTSFSASVDTIFADSTIETNFAAIRGITVPVNSPLYRTGLPWYDGNPINIGPNSGAPSSVADFWTAFRALGLKEYNSNGNIIP
jgi:hypothetical protein